MRTHRIAVLVGAALTTACGMMSGGQAVRVTDSDEMPAERWQGSISSPRSLSGAVEMTGTAWMGPVQGSDETRVAVTIENASPGGVHPWAVHRGRCGADQGTLGSASNLDPLEVGDDGRARAEGTLDVELPRSGDYFVAVYASPTNRQLVVACANLAPPIG